jgi:enhancer of mRNA-decapping protein 4
MGGEVAKNLTSSLRQPIQEVFMASFQDSLIPAFEKTCQAMFRQLSTTFERGLQDRVIQLPGEYDSRRADAVTQQLKSAVDSLQEISKNIMETQTKVLNDYMERVNGYPFYLYLL